MTIEFKDGYKAEIQIPLSMVELIKLETFMRNFLAFIGFIIFLWFALYETEIPNTPEDAWGNVKPDSLREPHHFNWETNQYVYTDEIKEDTEIYDWGPLTSIPDYSVKIAGGYQPPKARIRKPGSSLGGTGSRWREPNELPEIKLHGEYYRQRVRADGVIQLIPIR